MKPGRVASPVQITDWMPTFCSLAGYESERDLKWDGADLTQLLNSWGKCVSCDEDLDGDDLVGFNDLTTLLSNWGPRK